MKKVLIILVGLFLLFSTPAIAQQEGVCYDLWCANAAPDGVIYLTEYIPYARVCLVPKTDCSSGFSGVTITVTANESIFGFVPGPGGTNFGIQRFGFNYTGVPSDIFATVTGADAAKAAKWSVVAGPSQVDGFGTFVEVAAPTTKPGDNRQQPLVISICSGVTDLSVSDFVVPNASAPAQHFAVHLAGFTTVNGVQYYYDSNKDGIPDTPLNSAYFANCGELTAIKLSSFTAQRDKKSVIITWTTETETDNAGFYIYRAYKDGEYIKINGDEIIPADGEGVNGTSYQFIDTTVRNRFKKYSYKLGAVPLEGPEEMHGPISVTK